MLNACELESSVKKNQCALCFSSTTWLQCNNNMRTAVWGCFHTLLQHADHMAYLEAASKRTQIVLHFGQAQTCLYTTGNVFCNKEVFALNQLHASKHEAISCATLSNANVTSCQLKTFFLANGILPIGKFQSVLVEVGPTDLI